MSEESSQALLLNERDPLPAASLAGIEEAARLRYVLQQSFFYRYAGPVAALRQRLVVVPRPRHGPQRRMSHRLWVIGADGHVSWSRDDFKNPIAHVRVPAVATAVEFQVEATVERSGRGPVVVPAKALRDPRYLDPTPLTAPDPALVHAARDATSALRSGREAAERICALVHAALPYRKGVTSVSTTAADAFAAGAGVCQDHAHVMLAMCHAVGLPARYVSGHLLGEGYTHAWVEVLVPHQSRPEIAQAVPFDPCHLRRPGASYVTVAVGRDYLDVAPTSGTYEGSASNQLTSAVKLVVGVMDGDQV